MPCRCVIIRSWDSESMVTKTARPPWATWEKQSWLPRMVFPVPGAPVTM